MELKLKIIKSASQYLWYNNYIGEEITVDTYFLKKQFDDEDIFINISLSENLRSKLKISRDPQPDLISDYGIYKNDTNFEQKIREVKLKKLNKI